MTTTNTTTLSILRAARSSGDTIAAVDHLLALGYSPERAARACRRCGYSPELDAALQQYPTLIKRLGGYGARVRGVAGQPGQAVEGTLGEAGYGGYQPTITTDAGTRYRVRLDTIEAIADAAAARGDADATQIRTLRAEALTAGDSAQVAYCDRALTGDAEAIAICAVAIAAAQAQEDC